MLTLRPYQQAAIDAIYGYFAEKRRPPARRDPDGRRQEPGHGRLHRGRAASAWPDQRILVVTHVRELIAQNFAELIGLWPEAPAGIYSAGLGRRDARARILFAGIQSIHRRAYDVQQCDLVLIDEAHLIPGASTPCTGASSTTLTRINPQLKVIGLTATPYRLDSGMLHDGEDALFTDIAYEVSVRELIDQGYLCPLVSKQPRPSSTCPASAPAAASSSPAQLEAAVDQAADHPRRPSTRSSPRPRPPKSWLAFCAGVDHATPRRRGDPRPRHLAAPPSSATRRRPSAIGSSPPSSAARSGRWPRWGC